MPECRVLFFFFFFNKKQLARLKEKDTKTQQGQLYGNQRRRASWAQLGNLSKMSVVEIFHHFKCVIKSRV